MGLYKTERTFAGQPISNDQYATSQKILGLAGTGLFSESQIAGLLAETMLQQQQEDPFMKMFEQYMGGGQGQQQQGGNVQFNEATGQWEKVKTPEEVLAGLEVEVPEAEPAKGMGLLGELSRLPSEFLAALPAARGIGGSAGGQQYLGEMVEKYPETLGTLNNFVRGLPGGQQLSDQYLGASQDTGRDQYREMMAAYQAGQPLPQYGSDNVAQPQEGMMSKLSGIFNRYF